MIENVLHKKLAQQNKEIAVSVPEQQIGLLLIEMAWSRGYDAWPDEGLPGIVCGEGDVL